MGAAAPEESHAGGGRAGDEGRAVAASGSTGLLGDRCSHARSRRQERVRRLRRDGAQDARRGSRAEGQVWRVRHQSHE